MSSQKVIQDLRSQLKYLKKFKSTQTDLISLYVPGSVAQINEASKQMTVETSQASNIKSKSTSKTVQKALKMLQGQVKNWRNKFPDTGLVFFTGENPDGKMECIVVKPVVTIQKLYKCDKEFVLVPLEEQLETGPTIGVAVFDTTNLIIGEIDNKRANITCSKTNWVPKKHAKGGQSAPRFQRQRV